MATANARLGLVGVLAILGLLAATPSAQKGKPAPSPCNLDGYCRLNEGTTCGDCLLPAAGEPLALRNDGTEFFHTGASAVTLFRWDGLGFKAVWVSHTLAGLQGRSTALGHLTGGPLPDLVTTQSWSGGRKGSTRYERVVIFRNGSLGEPLVGPTSTGSTMTTYASALHDFDGDGTAELVRARNHDGVVFLTIERWTGSDLVEVWRSSRFPQMFWNLAVGDVNADGKVEVLASTSLPGAVLVFPVTAEAGRISLDAPISSEPSGGASVGQISVADLAPNLTSAIVGGSYTTALLAWRYDGIGYPVVARAPFGEGAAYSTYSATGNLDDDPYDEIALSIGLTLRVIKVIDGQLTERASLPLARTQYQVAVGDVDGDGLNEILDGYAGVFRYAGGQLSQVNFSFGTAGYGVATAVR